MQLTQEQQEILGGKRGETMARVMQTLAAYGEAFDAERMAPITGEYGHTVIIGIMQPVYDLYDRILAEGCVSSQKISADPRPVDSKTFLPIYCGEVFLIDVKDGMTVEVKENGIVEVE